MAKLDYAIYGMDDNDFAEGVAADALRNTAGTQGKISQDAVAKGNDPEHENPAAKVVTAVGTQKAATSKGN